RTRERHPRGVQDVGAQHPGATERCAGPAPEPLAVTLDCGPALAGRWSAAESRCSRRPRRLACEPVATTPPDRWDPRVGRDARRGHGVVTAAYPAATPSGVHPWTRRAPSRLRLALLLRLGGCLLALCPGALMRLCNDLARHGIDVDLVDARF